MSKPIFICRECGGPIEATAEVDLAVDEDGIMTIENVQMDTIRWSAECGHDLAPGQVQLLYEQYKGLDAFGRAPGVGMLDIPVFPHPRAIAEPTENIPP